MKRLSHSLVLYVAILSQLLLSCCHAQPPDPPSAPLLTGADMLLQSPRLNTLRHLPAVAVVANHTSLVSNTHLVDTLLSSAVHVTRIFCPEHGFRGTAAAGATVDNSVDPSTGLPVISLYGKNKKPTPDQLAGISAVLFDLQDVGCRFYTYLSTLHYVMEACAEAGIPCLVLDRPNPNGHYIDGPVLDTATCRSFVGMHPVPVVYGLTIGEYAMMVNGEHWLKGGIQCQLTVVPMQGYRRDSAGYCLPVPPSPNLRNDHAIALYPSLCLFEGTNVSVGRGTDTPFEIIGIPSPLSTWQCVSTLFTLAGQKAPATHFTPKGGKQHFGIYLGDIKVPPHFDLSYLTTMYSLTKEGAFFLKNNFFDRLAGTTALRRQLQQGLSEEQIRASWEPALSHYKTIRKRYLIYPDF